LLIMANTYTVVLQLSSNMVLLLVYSFDGLVCFGLLLICTCAYVRKVPKLKQWLLSEKRGFFGVFYKGECITCSFLRVFSRFSLFSECNWNTSSRLRLPRVRLDSGVRAFPSSLTFFRYLSRARIRAISLLHLVRQRELLRLVSSHRHGSE